MVRKDKKKNEKKNEAVAAENVLSALDDVIGSFDDMKGSIDEDLLPFLRIAFENIIVVARVYRKRFEEIFDGGK